MKSGKNEEEGVIVLKRGKHTGHNRGFGAEHIWEQHQVELKAMGFHSKNDVPRFVSNIFQSGSHIHCEFNDPGGNHRITVIKNREGQLAILEKRYTSTNSVYYSVVTAYTKGKAHGTRIGTMG